MQVCVGKRRSWRGGRNSPTCMVTKCNGIQKSGDGARGHEGGGGEKGVGGDRYYHCKLTICTLEGGQVS